MQEMMMNILHLHAFGDFDQDVVELFLEHFKRTELNARSYKESLLL